MRSLPGSGSGRARRRVDATGRATAAIGWSARRAEHEGAAADFAADQPALANQRIGAADRADCHPDVEGEVALRRQLGSAGNVPLAMAVFDPFGKADIERSGALRHVGEPICHHDNFIYCIHRRVNALECHHPIGDAI